MGDLVRLSRAVRRRDVDAFLFPSVYTYFPVVGVPTVVGVHDAIADELPELTLPDRRSRLLWRVKQGVALRRATRVFTVSEASRAVLVDRFGLRPERLGLVPEAPDPVFGPRSEPELLRELGPLGLVPGSYLMYAGGISPHKNIETLLAAYAGLRSRRADAPPLVLVGDLSGDPYLSSAATVRGRIDELGLETDVLLPGFVSDERLACLYAGATAVVLPSLAEGFGLPAVEAAACGAPVLLSDLPAHRESLGEAAIFFRTTDVAGLSDQMARILDDPALRRSLAARGRAQVSGLSWDLAAERLRELIGQVAR